MQFMRVVVVAVLMYGCVACSTEGMGVAEELLNEDVETVVADDADYEYNVTNVFGGSVCTETQPSFSPGFGEIDQPDCWIAFAESVDDRISYYYLTPKEGSEANDGIASIYTLSSDIDTGSGVFYGVLRDAYGYCLIRRFGENGSSLSTFIATVKVWPDRLCEQSR